ncbi:hypothetical protein NKR23_g10812 [Pleurostoma richardsiae]|uniref:Uncharacterized protein n=1 Tax=Pleurostoma richardsiae TaxID=41990 RepID=A0AA38VBQ5_9PEZI|nr:hypothetical protein NKR23_g10812 [Pleurostoma richardsiae]
MALLQSCERMHANLEDAGRGYGWRLELRVSTELAAAVEDVESSLLTLVTCPGARSPSPTSDLLRPLAFAPDRVAFFVVAAREFNMFLTLARIFTGILTFEPHLRTGLGMAVTMARRGFVFFPYYGVDWYAL